MTVIPHEVTRASLQESRESSTYGAAALSLTSAVLTFLVGVFALTTTDLVVSGSGSHYTFKLSGWGWVDVLTRIVLATSAVAAYLSATWARAATVAATCLAIVVSFVWMACYPTASIVLIALDVVAIWGFATWSALRESA